RRIVTTGKVTLERVYGVTDLTAEQADATEIAVDALMAGPGGPAEVGLPGHGPLSTARSRRDPPGPGR
ncbi:hypothetical protein ACGFZ9_52200, partial [Streptomyces mirabilis]|uniref:hypothetical protein n=1 Tax=Streptomyces mirabilis TaxID=68239 RepID=UPI003712EDCA